MIRVPISFLVIIVFLSGIVFSQNSKKEKTMQGKICGNPRMACKADKQIFSSYDLPFETPKGYVVFESQPFYAIILKSVKIPEAGLEQEAFTEDERISVQKAFPNNKVFGTKGNDPGMLYYRGIQENTAFMGVYAGRTLSEANAFLKQVRQNESYKGAYIKRLVAEFNGT